MVTWLSEHTAAVGLSQSAGLAASYLPANLVRLPAGVCNPLRDRDEFGTLLEAKVLVAEWRRYCNPGRSNGESRGDIETARA